MKLALAGCGTMGSVFARAALKEPGIDLTGIYDPDAVHAWQLPDARTFESLEALLETRPDALLAATPQPEQATVARTAMAQGISVVMPLPLSAGRAEALSLIELAVSHKVKLIPFNLDRYRGNVRDVKDHIEKATIGRIGVVEMRRTVPATRGWYADLTASGGAVFQLLMPELDTLIYWLGEIENAYGYRRSAGGTDFTVLTAEAACGAIASISALWGGREPYARRYELSGSGGNLRFDSRQADSSILWDGGEPPFNFDVSLETAEHNPCGLLLADLARELAETDMAEVGKHIARLYELLEGIETIGEEAQG